MDSPDHYRNLVDVVRNNLENQQDWTDLRIHGTSGTPGTLDTSNTSDTSDTSSTDTEATSKATAGHPRILLTGLPPRRMYIHPDEQIAILKAERNLPSGQRIPQPPEYEWVLPLHLAETPSISLFASVFDSISALPRDIESQEDCHADGGDEWKQWRGSKRTKRLLLAVVQDDSSIVYYFMHDGIVKPRQN